jgi:diacylglycerol kinase family enzyme
VANANQFGNNAYISPASDLQDGFLEAIQIKPSNFWSIAYLGISLFLKKVHLHPLVTISMVKSMQFHSSQAIPYHLDGESLLLEPGTIEISIQPASLLVVK